MIFSIGELPVLTEKLYVSSFVCVFIIRFNFRLRYIHLQARPSQRSHGAARPAARASRRCPFTATCGNVHVVGDVRVGPRRTSHGTPRVAG